MKRKRMISLMMAVLFLWSSFAGSSFVVQAEQPELKDHGEEYERDELESVGAEEDDWLSHYDYTFNGDELILLSSDGTLSSEVYVPASVELEGKSYHVVIGKDEELLPTESLWKKDVEKITKLTLAPGVIIREAVGLFSGMTKLSSLTITGVDSSESTWMGLMFRYCTSLTSVDLSSLDTSNVSDMNGMFYGSGIKHLDLRSFDFSQIYFNEDLQESSALALLSQSAVEELYLPVNAMKKTPLNSSATQLTIHYEGTKAQWEQLANEVNVRTKVICSDGEIYDYVDVESIALDKTDVTYPLSEGSFALIATYTPSDVNSVYTIWSSTDESVATVSGNMMPISRNQVEAVVTLVGEGECVITATSGSNPACTASCTVCVGLEQVSTPQIKSEKGSDEVEVGELIRITTSWEDAVITYSIEGDTWNAAGTYADALVVPEGVGEFTITAYAEAKDSRTSESVSRKFKYSSKEIIIKQEELDDSRVVYDGSKKTPAFSVYYGDQLLTLNADYSLRYSNNVNAWVDDTRYGGVSAKPTVTVTLKGAYANMQNNTKEFPFSIYPADVRGEDFSAADVYLKDGSNIEAQLLWKNKKLQMGTDYYLLCKNAQDETVTDTLSAGEYTITISGNANFTGSRDIKAYVADREKRQVSALKIALDASWLASEGPIEYNGKAWKPKLKVTEGKVELTEGSDYLVSYENNTDAGYGMAIVLGTGNYSGAKAYSFKIEGIDIKKAKIEGLDAQMYCGNEIEPLVLKYNDVNLTKDKDYSVSYSNNINKGTATVQIKGKGQYSGSVKKSFRIVAATLDESRFAVYEDAACTKKLSAADNFEVPYVVGGASPSVYVKDGNELLVPGRDYKLSYKNNKALTTGAMASAKLPQLIINGIGNYSGKLNRNFTITTQDISRLSILAPDKVAAAKGGAAYTTPVISEVNGKKLSAGKDYGNGKKGTTAITYHYVSTTEVNIGTAKKPVIITRAAQDAVEKTDIVPANTWIRVTVTGCGAYTGTISEDYRIAAKSISSAKITIPQQTYTGAAITPKASEFVLGGGVTNDDFTIISYSNNVNRGTAKVTIQGKGTYGGTKVLTFKIK